jgi:hypothetical protein
MLPGDLCLDEAVVDANRFSFLGRANRGQTNSDSFSAFHDIYGRLFIFSHAFNEVCNFQRKGIGRGRREDGGLVAGQLIYILDQFIPLHNRL